MARDQASGAEVWRCFCNVDLGGLVHADLDALLTALYVLVDDFLPRQSGPGRPPRISDAELVCLAVAQVLLDAASEAHFLRFADERLGNLVPYIPQQAGYNKRLRRLAPQLVACLNYLACQAWSFCDRLRLLDSTPAPCASSRETAERSQLAGIASYGWCAAHNRYFWGFRLMMLCAPDGMPIAFDLVPANTPERQAGAEVLERGLQPGRTVLCDKGFAGHEFEQQVRALGATLLRPDRKNEPRRHGSLGRVRQWIESTFDTLKGQLSLERHGGRTLTGVATRVAQRLLALAAAIWHNQLCDQPGRSLVAYDH